MRIAGFVLILAAVCGADGNAHAAQCAINRSPVALTSEIEVRMTAPSGHDCRIRFHLPGGTVADSNEIVAHPHYGGVKVSGTTGVYYRSNPGYRGPDQFVFTICGTDGGKKACSNVRVRVDVREPASF